MFAEKQVEYLAGDNHGIIAEEAPIARDKAALSLSRRIQKSVYYHAQIARSHPQALLVSVFLGSILLASGLALTTAFSNAESDDLEAVALGLAEETGQLFSEQLDRAILPLFSLAQFATELDLFRSLPGKIGPAGEEGSLPFRPKALPDIPLTHRNITGVCDDPSLLKRYKEIASTIKANSGMDGILVNLQLAPQAVVCLLHPVINTEDFPEGVVMDNSGAIGHDLLTDPERRFIAEATIPADGVVIAGPLTLRQCQDCDPIVEQAFIARLPVLVDDYTIELNGVEYPSWGFAVALINWNEIVSRIGVYALFQQEDKAFRLTRKDQNFDAERGAFVEKVVLLAQSPGFDDFGSPKSVTAALQTTNNEWEITVIYNEPTPGWKIWAMTMSLTVSFFIAGLVYTIIFQKTEHSLVIAKKSADMLSNARRQAVAERELNDYIAHEVRNPLSAAISACSFVSSAVNETEPLMTKESQTAAREDVVVIEASLYYINDLLRNMLDLHRAASNQLVIERAPTDIRLDVLDPVASMLYHRDDMYEVIVECPPNLVVNTDRLRLKQIILNLSRNAAKFVRTGFVLLKAEQLTDGVVRISVEDSGPGIPPEKRKNLYCRFQESLDALNQGTGIGLNLCRKLVDLLEGKMWLDESYVSGVEGCPGARFVVDINASAVPKDPADGASESDPEMQDYAGPDQSKESTSPEVASPLTLPESLSILFVDDDIVLRKLFARSVKKLRPNWNLTEAANGETALLLVDKESFDVIFLDQYMASVEKQLLGTETARALRAKGVKSKICGLSANDLEVPFVAAGANRFMIKPFPCKVEALENAFRCILFES